MYPFPVIIGVNEGFHRVQRSGKVPPEQGNRHLRHCTAETGGGDDQRARFKGGFAVLQHRSLDVVQLGAQVEVGGSVAEAGLDDRWG